ncbi:DUF418 domain-containing protein [Streptosporangium amethystogenes subsp. fukuiense]|uniref:DUF418 domain-containing protein n=1 Tax=Streptosporangium amethystogenes subsp. fukuiense TaxID=698418 RepID=A0ABW2T8F9_9ACTN
MPPCQTKTPYGAECRGSELRRYRYGPLEWLWRRATWAQRPPLRRSP